MTPGLPGASGAAIVRALERAGFVRVSQRGSHVKLRKAGGQTAIVPLHDDLAPGTLRSILKQAGLTADELRRLL